MDGRRLDGCETFPVAILSDPITVIFDFGNDLKQTIDYTLENEIINVSVRVYFIRY